MFLGWEPEDREKALGWRDFQAPKCHSCGTVPEEWLDEKGRMVWPPPYKVHSRMCYGCAMLEEERKEFDSDTRQHVRLHLIPRQPGDTSDLELDDD